MNISPGCHLKTFHRYLLVKDASASELQNGYQWFGRISPQTTVHHSFKKCCIINVFDGTEDDPIWEGKMDISTLSQKRIRRVEHLM